jgi:hypothetical protein
MGETDLLYFAYTVKNVVDLLFKTDFTREKKISIPLKDQQIWQHLTIFFSSLLLLWLHSEGMRENKLMKINFPISLIVYMALYIEYRRSSCSQSGNDLNPS